MFNHLRIPGKLLACFSVLVLAMLCLAGLSMSRLSTMNAVAQEMGGDRREQLDAIAVINASTATYRANVSQHLLARSAADKAQAQERLDGLKAKVQDRLDWLRPRMATPELRRALDHFADRWEAYRTRAERTAVASNADNYDAALAFFRAAGPYFVTANAAADAMRQEQVRVIDARLAEAAQTYATSRAIMVGTVVAVLALTLVMLLALVRSIARPVAAMTGTLARLAAGDRSVEIPATTARDEIGDMTQAAATLRDQLAAADRARESQAQEIVGSIGAGLESLAGGDLTARVSAELTGPFAKLKIDFNRAMEAVEETVCALGRVSGGVRVASGEIRSASENLSQRTEQQAASLEQTAASMDEITVTVRATAEGAARVRAEVEDAQRAAEQGGEVVREAVTAMGGIERASHEISEIISVIDGIAFQTNLLALNAGVEAARAGDAGKGFAVVASEVRALAQRSADAAKDVKTRIGASGEQVEAGVALVRSSGQSLVQIIERIGTISTLTETIAASAQQQALGLAQVNTAVGEMDSMTQQNAAMVEESTAAARSLAAEADELAHHVGRFQTRSEPGAEIAVLAERATPRLRVAARR
ncbi:methyl-accepting chemotaxis protein [Sphingomonas sp. GM_Shp_2]|uniref:methyl-accepting chemotaxis protein n=1 Tax=Sphingomonas sp. GM_Shp_2 TaxID=2937380 RepID=UPI00226AD29C